jgi:hypothetical protein
MKRSLSWCGGNHLPEPKTQIPGSVQNVLHLFELSVIDRSNILDHKNGGPKNDGNMGSSCVGKGVLRGRRVPF